MYSNLNAELARQGMSRKQLAEALGMPYSTLLQKLRGETGLTLGEAIKIKKVLNNDQLTLEKLFA